MGLHFIFISVCLSKLYKTSSLTWSILLFHKNKTTLLMQSAQPITEEVFLDISLISFFNPILFAICTRTFQQTVLKIVYISGVISISCY
jgi:hypothetical protein